MSVISTVGKIVLVVVNLLILLLSIAMIICGLIVVDGKDIFKSSLDTQRKQLEVEQNNMGFTISTSNMTFTDVLLPLAYGVIIFGVIMGALALLGCVGGCYSLKLFLMVYATVTLAFFLVQVVLVIVTYVDSSAYDGTFKPKLKETLDTFSGIESTDAKTLAWNALMNYEKCCGVDSYKDFVGLKHWPPSKIGNQTVDLMTPVMCCKVKSKDIKCAEKGTANESNNWLNTGCYDKLFDMIVYDSTVITIVAILLAFQFILIFFTTWILYTRDEWVDNK